ncbi:MAG: phosphoglucosamine mutase [Flavobacteriaceae bacterium TMED42]|nr:MAG: phosphoglucosamine mutase [Flavobacteriaceae bacterium TMED42]
MTLIKSISGIRGTIGGKTSDNLTPLDTVLFTSAYASWLKNNQDAKNYKIVVGRDARISGSMIQGLVNQTLVGFGIEVLDVGLSTTPTVEMSVTQHQAHGGIIITASHNPKQWNALKLLNEKGEFLNAASGKAVLEIAKKKDFEYASIDNLGKVISVKGAIEDHVQKVLDLSLVNAEGIRHKKFKVVVDAVNSTGGIAIPLLLEALGVTCIPIYCDPTGHFPHNPEPLKEHLTELSEKVVAENADFGIVVDPDVDRLAFVDENGAVFGEEYTLVACSDYVLSKTPGDTVSNLSSTRALSDITQRRNGVYYASAVGEVNVVEKMKEVKAIIGGEGNGGIIYPDLHYGRDALVGVALFLSLLTENNQKVSELRASYPHYAMSKAKVSLSEGMDVDALLKEVVKKFSEKNPETIDGVKIAFESSWVHLRKSNTEPIIRVYTEAKNQKEANELAQRFLREIEEMV